MAFCRRSVFEAASLCVLFEAGNAANKVHRVYEQHA